MVGGNNNGNANSNSFAKTICSICYEDLKPLVEDLQSISVCGHVFHELCLQQWFEYCPNSKKRSCPICKQTCTNANTGRLYFQSISDPNDSCSQKPRDYDENPEELRKEVTRLEGKVVGLASTLEHQQKDFKELKDQLFSCKEQLKAEVALKTEALAQAATSQQLLRMKSEDLDKSTLERMRVQERNMALAKELAALKLATDLDLEEDDVVKLASLGNDVGSRETVDTLKKSLVIRNKRYKELMAKCNTLGRGEARYLRKLEKANEKIEKLKLRVQGLEIAVEVKDNEALRVLKDQNINVKNTTNQNPMKGPADQIRLAETNAMPNMAFCSREIEPCKSMKRKTTMDENLSGSTDGQNEQVKGPSLTKKDDNMFSCASIKGPSYKNPMLCSDNNVITEKSHVLISDSCIDTKKDVEMVKSGNQDEVSRSLSKRRDRKRDHGNKMLPNVDDEVICLGDKNPFQTSVPIKKEISSLNPVSQPGDPWFSGGLMGPDGTNWHLGKWCKKAQTQGSNARTGDLIAVGADGRGGQIKVIRSLDQSSSDINDTTSQAKKCKVGAKPNKLQQQGLLQIDHFFQRMGR